MRGEITTDGRSLRRMIPNDFEAWAAAIICRKYVMTDGTVTEAARRELMPGGSLARRERNLSTS